MAIAEEPLLAYADPSRTAALPLAWLAIPGIASIGAGAIHAAAIGAHSEHRQAVVVFAVLAAFQVGWGALALTRTHPAVAVAGALGNLGALYGWAMAKTGGISFVDGLEVPEAVQFADAAAAALAAATVVLVLVGALARRSGPERVITAGRALTAVAATLVTAFALPAMVSAGSHRHAHGEGEAAAGHTHAGTAVAAGAAGSAGTASGAANVHAVVPPKPYDPTKPIDLGGVPGVTPEQQARAENLIAVTLLRLPKFADPTVAFGAGYRSIEDAGTGYEHYINWSYIDDGVVLDPDRPESLVYRAYPDGRRELQAAMYMLSTKDTLDTVPDVGGVLTQWHIHDNLCFTDEPGNYKVRGLTNADGSCTPPLVKPAQAPMIHVWTVKHRCGPFAALDGVGAGQIKPAETRLCDHAHGGS
jgi:hypothetical protein